MKTYLGSRTLTGTPIVIVKDEDGKPYNLSINPSLRLRSHSPEGFNWGYHGSGPAQLALAILLDVSMDKHLSEFWHQDFKSDKIATLLNDDWKITSEEVREWIKRQELKRLLETPKEEHQHAIVKIGDYEIPLLWIPRDATLAACDSCHGIFYLTDVELNQAGNKFLCAKCHEKSTENTPVAS